MKIKLKCNLYPPGQKRRLLSTLMSLEIPFNVPPNWAIKKVLSLKLFLVKTWNIKHGHIRKLDLESTYFVDLHGIVIHDADRIGAVISEGDILNLFQGDKTNTTVPQSKLSGTLAASGKETLRREYERKQEEYMRELMRPKPKINWELKKRVYKEHKSTPFELAGIGATDRMFESFKHNGLGLNDVDSQGRTALLIAATFDHYDTCHELLEAGANPDILDYEGWTALAAVCRYGHVSILILLLDNGADRSLRATGGPWHMEHLVVHGKACQDNVKRDQVLSILRGHRIAGSWLEIIDSHWLSIGGRPDYDEMINNTSEFLRKYGEKLEKEEKEEFEAMEEAKRNGMEYKKESTEKNSSLDLIGPWNLPLKSKDRKNNEAVLFHVFQQMLQSTNKNKSRHFIQQIPMDSDLLLSPEELKKKKKKERKRKQRNKEKEEEEETPMEEIAEHVITKDQLFESLRSNKEVIMNMARFSTFKPILRNELFSDLYDRLITRTSGLLNFSEFLQFLEYGENEGENRLMLRRLFDAIDFDNSGTIEKKELLTAFNYNKDVVSLLKRKPSLAILLRPELFKESFFKFDTDENGMVNYEEFVHFVTVSQATANHRAKLREIFDIIDHDGKEIITKRGVLKAFTVNKKIIKLVNSEPLLRILLVPRLWEKAFMSIESKSRKTDKVTITFEEFASFVLNQKHSKINPVLLEYLYQSITSMSDDYCTRRQMFRSLTRNKNIYTILSQTGPLKRLVQGPAMLKAFKRLSKKRGYFSLKDFLIFAAKSKKEFREEKKRTSIFKEETINSLETDSDKES